MILASSSASILIIGIFYYTLGNFRPELRSTQRAIQLISCISSENISRYGLDKALEPFISDANELCEVNFELYEMAVFNF